MLGSRRITGRVGALAVAAVTGVAVLGGCGQSDAGQARTTAAHTGGHTHVMPDGTVMKDSQMKGMDGMSGMSGMSGMDMAGSHQAEDAVHAAAPGHVTHMQDGPSSAAAMICNLETAKAVQRNFALPSLPTAVDGWTDGTYRCDYQLPGGLLRLSVKDLHRAGPGRAWFDKVKDKVPHARTIKGMQSLGFPAFQAPGGQVGFLKDGRTLLVDASNLPTSTLPPGFTRTAVAYGVASAVMACWSE